MTTVAIGRSEHMALRPMPRNIGAEKKTIEGSDPQEMVWTPPTSKVK